jgi:hypothetical protein
MGVDRNSVHLIKRYIKWTTAIYFIVNVAGMALFAWFVFCIERLAHAEERQYRDASDGITFFTTAVPVLLIWGIGNFFWLIKVVADLAERSFSSTTALLIAMCSWSGVIYSTRFMDVLIDHLSKSAWLSRLLSL